MPYSFPGMNPWLENPLLWHDVHQSLIVALRDALAPHLRPRYYVVVETHTYIVRPIDLPVRGRFSDVIVIERGLKAVADT